jgi:ribosomal protein L19
VAGKPEKPPNSGYSLFSRIMLVSPEIKQVAAKERMSQISKLWKSMTEGEKKKYQERVNHVSNAKKITAQFPGVIFKRRVQGFRSTTYILLVYKPYRIGPAVSFIQILSYSLFSR